WVCTFQCRLRAPEYPVRLPTVRSPTGREGRDQLPGVGRTDLFKVVLFIDADSRIAGEQARGQLVIAAVVEVVVNAGLDEHRALLGDATRITNRLWRLRGIGTMKIAAADPLAIREPDALNGSRNGPVRLRTVRANHGRMVAGEGEWCGEAMLACSRQPHGNDPGIESEVLSVFGCGRSIRGRRRLLAQEPIAVVAERLQPGPEGDAR